MAQRHQLQVEAMDSATRIRRVRLRFVLWMVGAALLILAGWFVLRHSYLRVAYADLVGSDADLVVEAAPSGRGGMSLPGAAIARGGDERFDEPARSGSFLVAAYLAPDRDLPPRFPLDAVPPLPSETLISGR